MRLVGGRRPSMLATTGVWGSPQTVSGCAQGAAGTVALGRSGKRGAKKRDFEAAKEQCRIDNQLEIACNVLWIVRPPLALPWPSFSIFI